MCHQITAEKKRARWNTPPQKKGIQKMSCNRLFPQKLTLLKLFLSRPGSNPFLHQVLFGEMDADGDGIVSAWEFDSDLDQEAAVRFRKRK